ncbi:putative 2-carboxy-D-arabinitol-1-phosphatase [Bidens hawaiensis]|uniref:putative 2-carboxy-D-arabinitol-1-phosphatase n=1 Tax=Bidens hawaiensis TaxID=980011 RepID=UPI00404AF005
MEIMQAEKCKKALVDIHFDQCLSSPISRAKSTAEILWSEREEPVIYLDMLKEAHLFHLEGMKNVEARKIYPNDFITWREDPSNFNVNGVYPLREVWKAASVAWKEILFTPGDNFLVVTHKSILWALICMALGLGPERFRAFEVNNGGISVFKFNVEGEASHASIFKHDSSYVH